MNDKNQYLKLKDHSVSGEEFQLVYHQALDMLETFPQPSLEKLPEYYKSEDYISHTDSRRNLFEKAYHFIKTISLKRKIRLINSVSKSHKTILDVGCGTGDFLKLAKADDWSITGIEPNDQARHIANKKTNNSVFAIDKLLEFDENSFDVITLWHVLEHLPKLGDHIALFKKILKPNGVLIIAVPNYKSYDAKHYNSFWAAYDVPRHLWHFSKTSISKLVEKEKMQVVDYLPMKFDAYYVSLLSEKYKTGSMKLFKGFWYGLLSNLKARSSGEYSSLIYIIKNSEK